MDIVGVQPHRALAGQTLEQAAHQAREHVLDTLGPGGARALGIPVTLHPRVASAGKQTGPRLRPDFTSASSGTLGTVSVARRKDGFVR